MKGPLGPATPSQGSQALQVLRQMPRTRWPQDCPKATAPACRGAQPAAPDPPQSRKVTGEVRSHQAQQKEFQKCGV